MRRRQTGRGGFSLIELMVVVALGAILLAIAIPNLAVGERVRVNNAASEVREALQTARLRAVSVNRPLQIRFNCPATNQYRIVEAGFAENNRCSPTAFPYPASQDAAYRGLPRYDGPVQMINRRVSVSAGDPTLVLQFGPDGRAWRIVGGAQQVISSVGVPVTLTSSSYTRTINVNSLGKVVTQ